MAEIVKSTCVMQNLAFDLLNLYQFKYPESEQEQPQDPEQEKKPGLGYECSRKNPVKPGTAQPDEEEQKP